MTKDSITLGRLTTALGKILEPDFGEVISDTFKNRKNYTFEGIKRTMRKKRPELKSVDTRNIGIMNSANTIMIVPKNEFTFQYLYTMFKPIEEQWLFIPSLDFKSSEISETRFSIEYIEKIIRIFKSIGEETIQIRMSKDYPGIFMTSELSDNPIRMEIIVAPRVDEE